MSQQKQKKINYCTTCSKNGFPNEIIAEFVDTGKIYPDTGKKIWQLINPDGSIHTHKKQGLQAGEEQQQSNPIKESIGNNLAKPQAQPQANDITEKISIAGFAQKLEEIEGIIGVIRDTQIRMCKKFGVDPSFDDDAGPEPPEND